MPLPVTAVIATTQREAMRLAPPDAATVIWIRPNAPVLGLQIDHLIVAANAEANLHWWAKDIRTRLAPHSTITYADDHRVAGT